MSSAISSLGAALREKQARKNQWLAKPQQQQPIILQPKPQPLPPKLEPKPEPPKPEPPKSDVKPELPVRSPPKTREQPKPKRHISPPPSFNPLPPTSRINHEPKCVAEIFGQRDAARQFTEAMRTGGLVLLYGPPGCGKSAMVKAYCTENRVRLIDLTMTFLEIADFSPIGKKRKKSETDSDNSTPTEQLISKLNQACFGGTVFEDADTKKIVLIDDAEAFPANVWQAIGGVKEKYVKRKMHTTLVVIVNNAYEGLPNKHRPVFNRLIPFSELKFTTVFPLLQQINETVGVTESMLRSIASECNGDFRRALHMLSFTQLLIQFLSAKDSLPASTAVTFGASVKSLHLCMTDKDTSDANLHLGNFERFRQCVTSTSLPLIHTMAEVEPRLMSAFTVHNYPACCQATAKSDILSSLDTLSGTADWIAASDSLKQGNFLNTYTTTHEQYWFYLSTCAPMYTMSTRVGQVSGRVEFPGQVLKAQRRPKMPTHVWSSLRSSMKEESERQDCLTEKLKYCF